MEPVAPHSILPRNLIRSKSNSQTHALGLTLMAAPLGELETVALGGDLSAAPARFR